MIMEQLLTSPKVAAAANKFECSVKQDLALVFIKAFGDEGNRFPIDFNGVWRFLGYSTKGNALRKLKSEQFLEGEDYVFKKGEAQFVVAETKKRNWRGSMPDSYMLSEDAFQRFAMSAPGERGTLVRRYFLAVQEQYFCLLEGLRKRCRPGEAFIEESNSFLEEEYQALAQEITERPEGKEKAVQQELCLLEDGVMEVRCDHGVVDLLTEKEVIEVKEAHLWKHALGQVLSYKNCFPKHAPRIHLFTNDQGRLDMVGVCRVCSQLGVRVTLSI